MSTVNGGVYGLVRTLATELAPIRVNALHPGIVGDSPVLVGQDRGARERSKPARRLDRNVTMADIVDAVDFLLRNGSVNGVELPVDGGWLLT